MCTQGACFTCLLGAVCRVLCEAHRQPWSVHDLEGQPLVPPILVCVVVHHIRVGKLQIIEIHCAGIKQGACRKSAHTRHAIRLGGTKWHRWAGRWAGRAEGAPGSWRAQRCLNPPASALPEGASMANPPTCPPAHPPACQVPLCSLTNRPWGILKAQRSRCCGYWSTLRVGRATTRNQGLAGCREGGREGGGSRQGGMPGRRVGGWQAAGRRGGGRRRPSKPAD